MALPLYIGFLLNCFFIITMMFREEQARSPTKSERDSAGSGGLVRGEGIVVWQSLR